MALQRDVLKEMGPLALGSRLKRLAERLQTDGAKLMAETGADIQPSHFPLVACLDRYGPVSVVQAAGIIGVSQPAVTRAIASLKARGLIELRQDAHDSRYKSIRLTRTGQIRLDEMKRGLWPAVAESAGDVLENAAGFLDQLQRIEEALDAAPLYERATARLLRDEVFTVLEYEPALARDFYAISYEWISDLFEVEDADRLLIENPEREIIDKGGCILFVRSTASGVIGTGALLPHEEGVLELSKMGVLKRARGRAVGAHLVRSLIERARAMKAETLFLVTSTKCAAAIHLYEKHGFVHDPEILKRYGAVYSRCDVAMRLPALSKAG